MLDLIFDTMSVDFGWIHTYSLSSISQSLIRDILYNTKSSNFSSAYASKKKVYEKVMAKLVENVEKIDY